MPSGTPSASVYVKNLNTKVKKEELRRQLYGLFGSYGKVLDVVATRADGMRGQAFVVFRDLQSATSALRGLEGFEFYDKPMKKSYASLVNEFGQEALLNPGLMSRINEGTLPATVKVTYSHAQAEVQGLDKKRTREEGAATDAPSHPTAVAQPAEEARPAKTQRTDPASDEDEDDAMELADSDED